MVWLQFLSIHSAVLPVPLDILTVIPLLLCLLVLILVSTPFFLEPFQIGVNFRRLFDPKPTVQARNQGGSEWADDPPVCWQKVRFRR